MFIADLWSSGVPREQAIGAKAMRRTAGRMCRKSAAEFHRIKWYYGLFAACLRLRRAWNSSRRPSQHERSAHQTAVTTIRRR
jgi:hypothetical protein